MEELRSTKALALPQWLILGDFNLIRHASEKSNTNINLRMMGKFRRVIEDLELREFNLPGHKFTWSNESEHATLTKIDRILFTKEWEIGHLQYHLTPASTSISDHCPLILKKM